VDPIHHLSSATIQRQIGQHHRQTSIGRTNSAINWRRYRRRAWVGSPLPPVHWPATYTLAIHQRVHMHIGPTTSRCPQCPRRRTLIWRTVLPSVEPISAVGRLLLQARLPGTRCQTISVIRRLAKTLLGDYWRHTCLRCTSARSALEAFA